MPEAVTTGPTVIDVDGLDQLITTLAERGRTVVGPTVRDGAVVPGPVASVDDLPRGRGDDQRPGYYRLTERDDGAFFGYAAQAMSFKPVLFPPNQLLWRGTRTDEGFAQIRPDEQVLPRALLGVRSCDLAAIRAQDRVLIERWGNRPAQDVDYAAARERSFVIAVACGTPASTCFCTSMNTGPAPGPGYDLALTEIIDEQGHRFLVEVGTDQGAEVLEAVTHRAAEYSDEQAAKAVVQGAVDAIERRLATDGLAELLDREIEHPHWEEVAERCLACGNCTSVCPTCFCTSVKDVTDLTGNETERWRTWDSCFTENFSYVHGGAVRSSTASRYRQWMSHKLGTWQAQFDASGCVGCGRCITWCPVGIDITEEAAALQSTPRTKSRRREATS